VFVYQRDRITRARAYTKKTNEIKEEEYRYRFKTNHPTNREIKTDIA